MNKSTHEDAALESALQRMQTRPPNTATSSDLRMTSGWDQWDNWDDADEWTDIVSPGPET